MPADAAASSLVLRPDRTAPARARAFLADRLAAGDLDRERMARALLALSELVTNAVEHAATEIVVRVEVTRTGVHAEVIDGSTDLPTSTTEASFAPGEVAGWGLGIVEAMTDRWGCELHAAGKRVWFAIDAAPEA